MGQLSRPATEIFSGFMPAGARIRPNGVASFASVRLAIVALNQAGGSNHFSRLHYRAQAAFMHLCYMRNCRYSGADR
jgi:hypothetical protein